MFKYYTPQNIPHFGERRSDRIVVIPINSGNVVGKCWIAEWAHIQTEIARRGQDDLGLVVMDAKAALIAATYDDAAAMWEPIVIKSDSGAVVAVVMTLDCFTVGLDWLKYRLEETGEWGIAVK